MFISNNVVDTEYFILFKEKDQELIGKRIRNLITSLANSGLNSHQVTNEDLSKFKPINSIIDSEALLNDEMIDLMMWIRNTTLCTYFDAFRTLIPIGLGVNLTTKYILSDTQKEILIFKLSIFFPY